MFVQFFLGAILIIPTVIVHAIILDFETAVFSTSTLTLAGYPTL